VPQEKLEAYYEQKTEYDSIGRLRLEGILKVLGDYRDSTILDVGCGQGILGKWLKERVDGRVTIHGIDISPRSVEIARGVLDRAEMVDITRAEELAGILQSGKYDFIILSEVLEHLFWPEHVLKAIDEFGVPGVKVIVTVPNVLFWKNRLKILRGKFEYKRRGLMDRGHIHFFTWKSFRKMAEECGFAIKETAHHVPTLVLRPIARLSPGLAAFQFIVRLERVSGTQ